MASVLAGSVGVSLNELGFSGNDAGRPSPAKQPVADLSRQQEPEAADLDRQAIQAAGFTDQEAVCWSTLAKAVTQYFELPELHPMDKQEVAAACHIIQNKLLSRPTYRLYLAEAKKLRGE